MARNRRPRIYDQEHSAREGEPVAVQVVAYDRNPGDTLTYTIVSGNSGGLFQIDPLTGVITRADGGAFDYETDARRYDLRVRVTDDGNPPKSRTADVTIRITNEPDAPHEITVSNLSVDENAVGAVIGTVAIADQDDDYHVVTVDDSRFEIVGDVLKLKAGEALDHETDDPVTVTITASDDDNGSLSQSFTVAVNDLNEAPTGLSLSNAAVDENVAGAVVGLITVADPDDPLEPFGMHSFSVDDARFEVVGGVLKLKDGEALDHESGGSVLVTVTATDGGGLSTSEIFEIAVNDLNEAPTAITLSDTSVDEATVGAVVGAVTVIDPDDSSAPFGSHAIVVDDDRFEVAGGVLKLKDGISLDHETGAPITVTVTATDGGGAVVAQAFDISITDVNEAPTAISLSNNTVDEVTAGATIGVLSVTDPDDPTGAFGTHSFGVNDFRFEVVDGVLKLKPGYILDHEAADSVTVTVTAIDGGGASLSQDFEIVVNDLNEAPTLSTFAFTVPEDAAIGAVVGTVPGSDPDDPGVPFGTLTYALTDDAGGRFAIDTATGAITTTAPLDHESAASFNVAVQVTDGGGLSAVRSYTINVGDVNEAPTGVTLVQAPPIVPDDAPGVYLGRIQVDDPDSRWEPFGQNTLTVTDPRFQLVQSYGSQYLKLKHGIALDFQSEPTVTVTFTATDATGSTTDLTLELEVVDTLPGKTFIPLGPLDGTNGSVIFSSDAGDQFIGRGSVSAAGDLNGDGYGDFVIGSPHANAPMHPLGGAAYAVFGGPSGLPAAVDVALLDGTDGFRMTGTSVFAGAGADVSTLGDINGDGFDDLLVTAVQMAATAGTGTGEYVQQIPASFVVFGKADGWDPSIDLSTVSGSDGFRIPSTAENGFGGFLVRAAGDVNGDGLDDMVIGDLYGSAAAPLAGSSYVVFGKTDGWTDVFDPSGLDGTDGYRIDGVGPADLAGVAVGGGDINGDGFDDLAIGSPAWGYGYGYGYNYSNAETVYVVFGGPAAPGPTLSLADIDGTNGFRVTGTTEFTEGFDLSIAGDVNGDGYDDLAISRADFIGGEAYVVFGGSGMADVDLAALDGTNGYAISGFGIDYFGAGIDIIGDVNADGYDDLLISSYGPNDAPIGSPDYALGAAYVVYGGEDGFGGSLDLARIDGSNGFRLDGTIPDGRAGIVSAAAGDVNGDGLADMLVGGVLAMPPGTTSSISEVYLFNGTDLTDTITGLGTSGSDTLSGTGAADSLVGAQGDDILVGNGGADVLYGGAGDDVMAVGDLSFVRIDGGSGDDTLRLDGAGQTLDLTGTGNSVIQGVERIDLTGSGDNAVTLAVTDLLAISDESSTLLVSGDAGDQANLIGDWTFVRSATVDGTAYNVFSVSGVEAELFVEDGVAITGATLPVTIGLSDTVVDENADGAAVGTLTVTPAGPHGLSVDDARFEIVGDVLRLKAGQSLDHELEPSVAITVTTAGGESQSFTIDVADVNEAPAAIALSNATVDEVAAGAVIGAVTVTDPDDPAQPFGAHAISVDDSRFEVVGGMLKLKDGVALDYADGASIDLVLSAIDGGGLNVDQSVTIAVNDVDEAPVLTVATGSSVAEEVAGQVVGDVTGFDPDNFERLPDPLFYSVDDARFEVSGGKLKLKDGIALDFESEQTVTLTVTAADFEGLSDSRTVTFDVRDVVEGGTFFSLDPAAGDGLSALVNPDPGYATVGYSVSDAGDVNGDGLADIVVGAPLATAGPEAANEGAAYVVFGTEAGMPASFDLTQIDGTNGFRINGTDIDFGGFGAEVSGAGDFNGDGYDDILVGARPDVALPDPFNQNPLPHLPTQAPNESFVIFGKSAGWTATVDLETLDAADGLRIFDDTLPSRSGHHVAELGDFNGDGVSDIAVASSALIGANEISYVLFGTGAGLPTDVDLATLDGGNGFRITGTTGLPSMGYVRAAGDLNADGYDDAVVARTAISTSDLSGRSYIVFGGPDAQSPVLALDQLTPGDGFEIDGLADSFSMHALDAAGDLNGDGHDDLVISTRNDNTRESDVHVLYGDAAGFPGTVDLSTLDGTDGVRIDGLDGLPWTGSNEQEFHGTSVSGAGDVNGDGLDDLIVANASNGKIGPGAIYVVYGQEGGLQHGLDVSLIDGTNGFRIDGVLNGTGAGFAVSGAGDLNGDGFHDLLIGEPWVNDAGGPYPGLGRDPYPGEAHVFYGGNYNGAVTGLGTAGADTLTGTAAADSLVGAQGDDLLVGNGGADVLYGGSGDDILAVGDLDFSRIDGGSGTDTLRLDGAGQSLDLTAIGDTVIEGVERLDLTGSGDNSATLAITDLLNLSDEGNDLFVAGDAGDQVTLVGSWQNDGQITVDGVTYNTFSAAGVSAALYVEDDITFTTGV